MTVYCVDNIAGNDSNTGADWANALKTTIPFTEGLKSLAPGDLIKLARTPDPVQTASTFTGYLAGESGDNNRVGWTPANPYLLPAANQSNIRTLLPMSNLTGFVKVGALSGALGTVTNNAKIAGTYIVDYSYAVGTRLCYWTLSTTANLSGFDRLEIPIAGVFVGYGNGTDTQAEPWWNLNLCSDTLGVTPIMSIPINMRRNGDDIFVYEGSLPDGINSVTLATLIQGEKARILLRAIIATRLYSSADYIGWKTHFRLGAHEGSFFVPPAAFAGAAGATSVYLSTCNVGAPSNHNTSMTLYYRKVVSWHSRIDKELNWMKGDGTVNENPQYNATPYETVLTGKRSLACLDAIQGTALNPIVMEGGYDTATDTVTGITYFSGIDLASHSIEMREGVCPFSLKNSAYLTFKNIHCFTAPFQWISTTGTVHDIRFENCTIIQQSSDDSTNRFYDYTFLPSNGNGGHYNAPPATVTSYNFSFLNCFGRIFPQAGGFYGHEDDPFAVLLIANFSYENCIFAPYSYRYDRASTAEAYANAFPITVVGSLKIYSLGCQQINFHYDNTYNMVALPLFTSGLDADVYVFGAGAVKLSYYLPPETNDLTYTFPRFVLSDTTLILYDVLEMTKTRTVYPTTVYLGTLAGSASHAVFPSISYYCHPTAWCVRAYAGSAFRPWGLVCFDITAHNLPSIEVQSISLHGGVISTGDNIYPIFRNLVGIASASNITCDSTGSHPGFISSPYGNVPLKADVGAYMGALGIIDGMNLGNRTLAANAYPLEAVYGILDFRNINVTFSSHWLSMYDNAEISGVVRFSSCNIVNPGNSPAISLRPGNLYSRSNQRLAAVPMHGWSGVLVEDCNAGFIGVDVTTNHYSGASSLSMSDPYAIVQSNTATGAYLAYEYRTLLEKDFTIYQKPTFSWKSTLKAIFYNSLSNLRIVGSVPAYHSSDIKISINLRRLTTTNNNIALVVFHHGAAGYETPDDYVEKKALHTAGAGEWQEVSVSFRVMRDELIDIYVAHYGAAGSIAWFDDIRVVEA